MLVEGKTDMDKHERTQKLGWWVMLLLVLGSPVWLSLIIAAFAVLLSLYVSLWSVIISLWAAFASFIGCSLGGAVSGVYFICVGETAPGVAMLGAALFLSGLTIFAFLGCMAATKGAAWLTKKGAVGLKRCFVREVK